MEEDPYEEEMEESRLDDEIERRWRMVFKDNKGGLYDEKAILHAKRWGIYTKYKWLLIKGGYSVVVSCYVGKKALW